MAGRKVFTSGEILTAADVNSYLMDQSVMVFADSTARSSAIPSPSEGMVTYREDANRVEVYDGSAFGAIGGILQVLETQKTTIFATSSSSLVDVTGLEVTITPSGSSSKFLILLHALEVENSGSGGAAADMGVSRDATDIGQLGTHQDNVATVEGNISVTVLDSPATASAITYKGRIRTNNVGALTLTKSSITVLEVAV